MPRNLQAFRQNNAEKETHKLVFLYKFFCWCSGARLYLLKQCPSEYNKYYGIGVIVFLTGVLASLSGGYAIFTVFNSLKISFAFGALWGFVIFSIDWYIVASLRKQNRISKEFAMALPRFVLAVLIAFVVSMPLKLKLFEKEINQQILVDQQESKIGYQSMLNEEFAEIDRLEQENNLLRQNIADKEKYRDNLFAMFVAEAEGLSPTGKEGKGPVYREKKAEYDKVENELKFIRDNNSELIASNSMRLNSLKQRRDETMETSHSVSQKSDGLLARLQAMSNLSSQSKSIMLASWFIVLLFITIESAPIIVKLLSDRGPYDDLLEAEEYIKQTEVQRRIMKAELSEDHQIDLHSLLEKERNDKLYEIEKEHIGNESDVLREINRLKILIWKNEEMEKLKKEVANLKESQNDLNFDLEQTLKIFEPDEPLDLKDIPSFDDDVDEKDINVHLADKEGGNSQRNVEKKNGFSPFEQNDQLNS
ncbi:MAG: DUF4407 domain-containing protein [Bacteroidales bacterium]|nr:DUF4407 domain-containing protein [Bacteroidales bacterium]MDY0196805.1 DUF4407 domain-containing protein [Tenuifilaceae bacterium]